MSDSTKRFCGQCGAPLEADAGFCGRCGTGSGLVGLPTQSPTYPDSTAAAPTTIQRPQPQEPMRPAPSQSTVSAPKPSSAGPLFGGVILGLILGAAGCAMAIHFLGLPLGRPGGAGPTEAPDDSLLQQYHEANALYGQNRYDEAKAGLERLAAANFAPALNKLGWMVQQGHGFTPDMDRALDLYRRAAVAGLPDAMNNVGAVLSKKNRHSEARQWLEMAAAAHHPVAQSNLGYMYLQGNGVQRNVSEALRLLNLSASGTANAQVALGQMYERGVGVTISRTTAVGWYRLAARQGHLGAQRRLRELRVGW